jgi:copper chaperone CopZ
MKDITLHIAGMTCGHCLNAVSQAVGRTPGVEPISVRMGRADLRVRDTADIEAAKSAIEDAGYRVEAVTGD